MDGSSGFKKEGNVEVPKICILPIGQQEVLKKKKQLQKDKKKKRALESYIYKVATFCLSPRI